MILVLSIVSSAAFYAASFLWVEYFWWGAFFFLFPVFYCTRFKKLTFAHGFMWGYLTYGLQLSALWVLTVEYGQGWFRFFAPGIAVCWFGLFSGLWFKFLTFNSVYVKYLATVAFFLFIDKAVLSPFFFELEGYPFVLPVLPLMYGANLGLLPILGKTGLLAGLILLQLFFAYEYRVITFCLIIGLFFLVPLQKQQGDWQNECIVVSHIWKEKTPYERAQEICHALIDIVQKYPEKRVIILPESVFPWPLHEHKYALTMWTQNALQNDKHLILGSYRRSQVNLFNTFYNVHQSRIIFYYDKTHMIPFFEKTNSCPLFLKGNDLFLSTKESFTKGGSHERWLSHGSLTFTTITPLLCSEAFWRMPHKKRAIHLVNDNYFRLAYFPKLMWLLAHLNAFDQDTDLLYCSWRSNF